jgi:glycosyltransferase involved in cell wall biosynthesis
MRVFHVISDKNIGGAGVLLSTILKNLDRERVQNIVALPNGSLLTDRLRALGVPILPLEHSPDRISAGSVGELTRLIRATRADLVHANAALSARLAGRLCHVGVLHTRHCCFPPEGIWRLPVIRAAGGIWNRVLSDRVIATADAAAENLRALGIPPHKITCIVNGSEAVRAVTEAELADLRASLGLSPDDFTVGIVARLVPCKGHDTLLLAAREAIDRMPEIPFRFLIVGDGPLREELERRARELRLSDSVRFTGFVRDMAPLWHSLRVNVNCSCGTETSCLALSEGMSVGVPMVVSHFGGNPAMLGKNGGAGFLCPVGDSHAFADAICAIAASRELEASMRREARRRYETYYTARVMTDRLTEVYEEVLAERK